MYSFLFTFSIFYFFGSAKIVCPRDTNFLSGQTVTVEINSSQWHYFIINLFKPDSSVKITLDTNTTAWLYRGSGMYCPNHAWIFSYKRLRSWWTTSVKVYSSTLDFFPSKHLARIQTFGIYTKNSTRVTITVSEESLEKREVPPFRILTSILIFITIFLLSRYLLLKSS